MRGEEIRQFRKKKNYSQYELADILGEALGRNVGQSKVSEYESGKRPVPESVSAFLDALAMREGMSFEDEPQPPPVAPTELGQQPEDSSPASPTRQPPISTSGVYSKVCEDLWEMVATGVGMVGAVVGSDTLMFDGQIIDQDKEALGKAYGKLAETNETFRKMLVGMTTSGAWLEVALVTGTTVGKLYRNHQAELYPHVNGGQAANGVPAAAPQE